MDNKEEIKSFRPVDYNEYKDGFTQELCELFENNQITDVEQMRRLMYGYTFTPEYARTEGQQLFSTQSWPDDEYPSQQDMIVEAIASTGDGLTPETAWYVIDVYQEYDFIGYYDLGQMMCQSVRNHIDCLELLTPDGVKKYYFNVQRRFEVGYCRHNPDFVSIPTDLAAFDEDIFVNLEDKFDFDKLYDDNILEEIKKHGIEILTKKDN